MVPLTVIFPIVFCTSDGLEKKNTAVAQARPHQEPVGSRKVLAREGTRCSGNDMSKPPRWISVKEVDLTGDHRRHRKEVVGEHLPHLFSRAASSETRAKNARMCILMRIVLFMRALKTLDTAICIDQPAGFCYWMLCGRLDARRTEEG